MAGWWVQDEMDTINDGSHPVMKKKLLKADRESTCVVHPFQPRHSPSFKRFPLAGWR
jgi:hypothetical protein